MAWPEKLKLNKRLIQSLTDIGYVNPKEIQLKTIPRISGGQDIIAIGPEGSGKTTAYILAVLNRFRYAAEGVPKVLILVPDKDRVLDVISRFDLLNKNKSLLVVGLYPAPGTEAQMNALADGADIVVATPDRARAIYLKLGLNLNKMEMLVIDDAELIVKQGLQLPVAELANSMTKCQHLVFTEVMHARLEKMLDPFMKLPALVEVEDTDGQTMDVIPQLLYILPNFGTKLNLLNFFLQDDEVFTKTVVFVNTRQTAETILRSLHTRLKQAAAILNPWFYELPGFASLDDFMRSPQARVLVVVNDPSENFGVTGIPFIIHFELPDDKQVYISRVTDHNPGRESATMALTFGTDLELSVVRKIEQATGQKIPVAGLPEHLLIEKERKAKRTGESNPKQPESTIGEAFHEKKAGNAKNYNYGGGQKAKMNKKRKHG
ncbi:DEAD/DEAH box helicase [Pedobacter sp. HMF7056]|uniref:DEAD/DEAH box helicase n=2 Tax=Hufsiella ginkgonis TaxID=2695274 RepID=A0A7K1XWL8_9SPHI|nr:DEAD/DEAH box helicase [Hufsiella ginkgonis]MXV15178.1 DEAD/DEAH box helicase [Hufsiella ginkgonis]